MGRYLRKIERKLNKRIVSATASKEERGRNRGGGGYADSKHQNSYRKPGSMRLDKN